MAERGLGVENFDYELPAELIAQVPVEPRDGSRLLVLDRSDGAIQHTVFRELPRLLRPGDLLVANESRVLPARLFGEKATGGRVEVLLLRQREARTWEALVRGKGIRPGTLLRFGPPEQALSARVTDMLVHGGRLLEFDEPVEPRLPELGSMPLPPYIQTELADRERYQTVYGKTAGSAAAPTAGLHFTSELLDRLQSMGVEWATVTLHVGLDTFRPVQVEDVATHQMHSEWYELRPEVAEALNRARAERRRIIAVGTTTVRVLETVGQAAEAAGTPILPAFGDTNIFIYPPYHFRVVDGLITNFHLPRSTLLMLVSALAGREQILHAYREAVHQRYRFFSFGDAMLIM
jgi:S-adenosylmethionine:tRNA ribosyltransferase-isomerase